MTARSRITALAATVIAVAGGATAAPAAHYTGGGGALATAPSDVEDLQDARLGPKYLTPHIAAGSQMAPAATPETSESQAVYELQDARLGPKFHVAPSKAPSATAEPTIVEVPSGGFDWRDASIGAGIAAAGVALLAAAAVLAGRHRPHRTPLGT